MHFSIPLLVSSLIYLILILVLFWNKEKINTIENNIYLLLLFTTISGVVLDILGIYSHIYLPETSIIRWLVVKSYMSYLLTFVFLLTVYIISVGSNFEKKEGVTQIIKENKFIQFLIKVYILAFVINIVLPFNYFKDGNAVYIYGLNSFFLYFIVAVSLLGWLVYLYKKRNSIDTGKILPIYTFILMCIPVILFQMLKPELLLVTSLTAFIIVFMYHTIENPDIKLINELNIARNQADKANNAKSEFLSSMSHEIRTPLNAILGFSQLLAEGDIPEKSKEEVKDIIMASENLIEIVNGILDISKIEANKLEIVNREYQLNKVLTELVTLTKGRLGDKPLDLKVDFDESVPEYLYGDYVRLKQIILNILTNSVKYTKEGHIHFRVSSIIKDDICRLIFSIEDTGIGIKKDKIDKLFTKFERFDVERNITIEGTGLGLAITKSLVELMEGKIVIQSTYGVGTKVTIAIDQKIIDGKSIQDKAAERKIDLAQIDLSGKKVLVVDDNKVNLKVATRMLEPYNLQIEQALSGQECLDKIEEGNNYDLILLDDMMPGLSGVEVLKILKEKEVFNVPTVVFTANAISGMREKYLNDGFDGYLSKPVLKTELANILVEFLAVK